MFHMGGGAWDQFDELSEKFERFKGNNLINCLVKIPLRKKFHTRAFRIIFFHRAAVFFKTPIQNTSSYSYFFFLNLFLIHEGLNITKKFIPKVFLD